MQADVEQEAEPAAHLLEHLAGNGALQIGVRDLFERARVRLEPGGQVADGHGAQLRPASCRRRARPEPAALSRWPWQARAADHAHVFFQLHAARPGRGLLETAEQLRHDAFPLAAVLPDAAAALLPFVGDVLVAGAMQQQVAMFRRQVLPGRLQVDAERLGHALVDVLAPAAHALELARRAEWPRRRS